MGLWGWAADLSGGMAEDFIRLPDMTSEHDIPKVITRQSPMDINCTMCAFNNIVGYPVWSSYYSWCNYVRNLWIDKIGSKRTEEVRKVLLACIIGPKGCTPDLLALALTNQHDGYSCHRIIENQEDVDTGFAIFRTKDTNLHCIGIKNGYAMDSITGRVWKWDGKCYDHHGVICSLQMVYSWSHDEEYKSKTKEWLIADRFK